ncbi:putative crossover junction endonuclease mus-81 [Cladorrhinum samala]|uniref:Crossover junction endonuclease MUS81 n=1 Tax=Cladorrhinum samala TaxID=585594 RepID=A0AAV9HTF0_9PEZI|nr:putative crossover junction endonuclease mus-81 [Cladorrhinum samala]
MSDPGEIANPLLLSWVKEWWEVAKERNTKGVITYKHAYDSLRACPQKFQHPSELKVLKGFGDKLCQRLTEQLQKHCNENGLPMPKVTKGRRKRAIIPGEYEMDEPDLQAPPAQRQRIAGAPKEYVPRYRSAAYAILLVLAGQDPNDGPVGMTKEQLMEVAQPHCDASMRLTSDRSRHYRGFDGIKTLIQHELACKRGRPVERYALTEEGKDVAKRIREVAIARGDIPPAGPSLGGANVAVQIISRPTDSNPVIIVDDDEDDDVIVPEDTEVTTENNEYKDLVKVGKTVSDITTLPTFRPIRLPPDSFTVELVLDSRETRTKTDRGYIQQELAKRGINVTTRALALGDALWVAKCNQTGWLSRMGAEGDEVVLDYILERKRLDDLISSIRDGRFREQKFRLRRSGLRNVVYLVEEKSLDPNYYKKYEEAVQTAMAQIQVVNGYFLKRTREIDETIRYLASMTKMLQGLYEGKPLHVIPTGVLTAQNYLPLLKKLREKNVEIGHCITYPAFASLCSKSGGMTLRDTFLKMLMCTRGVTGDRAVEIQKVWKTPIEFVEAFEACGGGVEGRKRKVNLVADRLDHLVGRKKFSKALSEKIAEVWGDA